MYGFLRMFIISNNTPPLSEGSLPRPTAAGVSRPQAPGRRGVEHNHPLNPSLDSARDDITKCQLYYQ